MNRENAISYLQRKDKIRDDDVEHPEFDKDEEELIKQVMKEGKIFGDPLVELN